MVFNGLLPGVQHITLVHSNSLHQMHIFLHCFSFHCLLVSYSMELFVIFRSLFACDVWSIGNVYPFETAIKQIELYKFVFSNHSTKKQNTDEPTSFISRFFFPSPSFTFISMVKRPEWKKKLEKSTTTNNVWIYLSYSPMSLFKYPKVVH